MLSDSGSSTSPPAPSGASPVITLPARAAKLGRRGHPWFYRDDLEGIDLPPNTIVRVHAPGGRDLGLGITSTSSKIALRLCGGWSDDSVPDPAAFFAERLAAAIELRRSWIAPKSGVRLVHSESDQIPGLIVDRYADVLVIQSTASFVEAHLDTITEILSKEFSPAMVLSRGDVPVRSREGLPQEVRVLAGEKVEETTIEEDGVSHRIRPFDGPKTGFYLDQRPARARVNQLARGLRVLDLFSYQGAFSLAALAGGAREVIAVDQSADALERASRAAADHGFSAFTTIEGNAFDVVRDLRNDGERFDLIVLDPPPFCKTRRELEGGKRGYRIVTADFVSHFCVKHITVSNTLL